MTNPDDVLFRLRGLVVDSVPIPAERARALANLDDAIADEHLAQRLRSLTAGTSAETSRGDAGAVLQGAIADSYRRRRRLRWLTAAAMVVLIGAAVIVGGVLVRTPPVTALGAIADVVATIPPEDFSDVAIIRDGTEQRLVISVFDEQPVPVIQDVTRRDRIATDGSIERTETYGEPTVLNSQDAVHLTDIRTELQAGQTITSFFAAPPVSDDELILTDNPDAFAATLEHQYERFGDPATPFEAYAIDRIVSLYTTTIPTPQQRAAILEFLVTLPNLTPLDTTDAAAVAYRHDAPTGTEEQELHFDDTGWLTQATLRLIDGDPTDHIPPGTETTLQLTPPALA